MAASAQHVISKEVEIVSLDRIAFLDTMYVSTTQIDIVVEL